MSDTLTKIQALRLSKLLWTKLAEDGCSKFELAARMENDMDVDCLEGHSIREFTSWCPACEYAFQQAKGTDDTYCIHCPIWPNHEGTCHSSFFAWAESKSVEFRKITAYKVLFYIDAKLAYNLAKEQDKEGGN